ncbi:MAG: polymerase subunit gamma/tau [Solirubrobacteraceae bacterium]|nr:polymerase subunit gamma/tau [Solirubrobacteraceae bacterium]
MSAGPSLYRRHRPRTFADVVGQEHVVRTLRNAVDQGKVHHAYLFVGSRGTGKTSMAKILAACLNCEHGPTVEPCGTCASCVAIASATSLDVIEMDAASNNSVDDIRDLRESVAYAPVSGRHKVYILDEAHMLSPQAWNAFLKTLEEPPPHTIFVLATTEAQKVLPTVVDRCHRFDFGRPTVEQLAAVISRVAGEEDVAIGPDAVALLARHATGSFRDALGTLEQLVTYSGREVATEDVLAVLGVADADLLFGALEAIGSHDARAALRAAARLASSGRDLGQVMRDLEAHARELLIVQTLDEVPRELHVTPDRDARLEEQSKRIGRADLVRFLELLADAMKAVKDGADARTRVELALVEAASPQIDPSARALMARLERLEAALASGGPPTAPIAPPEAAPAPAPRTAAPPAPAQAPARADDAPVAAAPEPPLAEAAVAVADPPPLPDPAPAPAPVTGLGDLTAVWPAVLDAVCGDNQLVGAALSDARPVDLRDHELVVAFDHAGAFNRRMVDTAEHRAVVEEALRGLAGRPLRVSYELRELDPAGAEAAAAPPSEDEIVARFVTAFDAQEIVPAPDENAEGEV